MLEREIDGKIYKTYRSRGSQQYKFSLFPEAPIGHKIPDFAFRVLRGKDIKTVHGPFFYIPHDIKSNEPEVATLSQINKRLGGQDNFFKEGSRVLDIGAGAGVAVAGLKMQYPNISFTALEKGYNQNIEPAYKEYGDYVGGDWNNLPFKENSFNRILSVESFPKHAEWIWDFERTFRDVTKVSSPGTIWRGTHFGTNYDDNRPMDSDWVTEMLRNMTVNGWDVYVSKRIFIAQLAEK